MARKCFSLHFSSVISHSLRRVRPAQPVFDGRYTNRANTHTINQHKGSSYANGSTPASPGIRWPLETDRLAPRRGPFRFPRAREMGQERSSHGREGFSQLHQRGPREPAFSVRTAVPCRRPGTERGPTPRRPSRVSLTPQLRSASLLSHPSPFFNCWMSLQSCVPKTINSREQSHTKRACHQRRRISMETTTFSQQPR